MVRFEDSYLLAELRQVSIDGLTPRAAIILCRFFCVFYGVKTLKTTIKTPNYGDFDSGI